MKCGAMGKQKIRIPDRLGTHDLPDTGTWEVMGANPVDDSDFNFVPRTQKSSFHFILIHKR